MAQLRKTDVNDVVHSFCFCCRNPESDWPAIIFSTGRWAGDKRQYEEREFTTGATLNDLQPFLQYINDHIQAWKKIEDAKKYMWLMEQLVLFSGGWSREEAEYAKDLMERYYERNH